MEVRDPQKKVFSSLGSPKSAQCTIRYERFPTKYLIPVFLLFCICFAATGDDPINTSRTWNREISRIVYTRCASCHRQGGTAFSLMTYQEARAWAAAIKEEALERRMPPWGAVKGFGDFRNDEALTQSQLDLIQNWVDGGAPEGDPNDLPPPPKFSSPPVIEDRPGELTITGDYRFQHPFNLDGFWPNTLPPKASLQVTIMLPDGRVAPLVWLHDYTSQYSHPFLLRSPLLLPVGTVIHGLPAGASLVLLPVATGHGNARSSPRSKLSAQKP